MANAQIVREHIAGMYDRVLELDGKVERIQESVRSGDGGLANLAREDVGWQLISGDRQSDEINLFVLKQHAVQARALRAANPLVRRGIEVVCAYLFEQPVKFPDSPQIKKFQDNPINQAGMDGETLESSLRTNGNYFLLVDKRKQEVRQIPMHQITEVAVHPDFDSEIQYFMWDRMDHTDPLQPKQIKTYIPAITLVGTPLSEIGGVPVDATRRIEHGHVNRQDGWRYGVPDLLGAVYWAKAYKEYLESVYTLNKALASLAFKATNKTSRGRAKVAAELRRPKSATEAGGTVSLGEGQDIAAINKGGAGADFAAGTPLAAMVAACVDIPLSVLLTDGSAGGRQGAETALEDPTIKTMNRRRKVHLASIRRVYKYLGLVTSPDQITWEDLDNFQVHRAMQSLVLGKSHLHPEEFRAATLRYLRLPATRPADDLPEYYMADIDVGALSDGTNDNRDNPTDA